MPRIKELTGAQGAALEQTVEALHTEVVQDQVVPRDQGTLQNEAMFVNTKKVKQGRVSIVHSTPYARRLYFHPEYQFSKDENPNAKGKWFEDWEPGGKKEQFTVDVYKEVYRRLASL
nr:MAG TPA: Minor capsid protein [Caudoviricetes sp.]